MARSNFTGYKMAVASSHPLVSRLLELSNDVEKNPGPPKIVRNGLINKSNTNSSKSNNGQESKSSNVSTPSTETASSTASQSIALPPPPTSINPGTMSWDDVKATIEKQVLIRSFILFPYDLKKLNLEIEFFFFLVRPKSSAVRRSSWSL